jgi:hypothetical protein
VHYWANEDDGARNIFEGPSAPGTSHFLRVRPISPRGPQAPERHTRFDRGVVPQKRPIIAPRPQRRKPVPSVPSVPSGQKKQICSCFHSNLCTSIPPSGIPSTPPAMTSAPARGTSSFSSSPFASLRSLGWLGTVSTVEPLLRLCVKHPARSPSALLGMLSLSKHLPKKPSACLSRRLTWWLSFRPFVPLNGIFAPIRVDSCFPRLLPNLCESVSIRG